MPTRKIADWPPPYKDIWNGLPREKCKHPEHNPPGHQVFAPGVWEHECPACGAKQILQIQAPTW